MCWVITLCIIALLFLVPAGICLIYSADGVCADLLIGPVHWKLFLKEKSAKKKIKKTSATKSNSTISTKKRQGGIYSDFTPFLRIVLDLLGDLRRKLRVKKLELQLVLTDDDPADLAVNYGKTWIAAGNLMPVLERILVIKKRDIDISCDFMAEKTTLYLRMDITITVGRFLFLAARYGIRTIRQYFEIKNKSKGGAEL